MIRGTQVASDFILNASIEMDDYLYTNKPENTSKITGPEQAYQTPKGKHLPLPYSGCYMKEA